MRLLLRVVWIGSGCFSRSESLNIYLIAMGNDRLPVPDPQVLDSLNQRVIITVDSINIILVMNIVALDQTINLVLLC